MGSQKVASLPEKKAGQVRLAVEKYRPRSRDARDQAARVAATAIGPVSKTSSVVQCLSSRSVIEAIDGLVGFSNKTHVGGASPQQIFSAYGVEAERPFAKFSSEMLRALDEKLVAQQKSTESANAVHDSLPRAILDILAGSVEGSPREATQQDFYRAFQKTDERKVATTLLTHVISSLIAVIIDAAGSEEPKAKQDNVKRRSKEEFSFDLARQIDNIARRKGVKAADIPRLIAEWAPEIESYLRKYRP